MDTSFYTCVAESSWCGTYNHSDTSYASYLILKGSYPLNVACI